MRERFNVSKYPVKPTLNAVSVRMIKMLEEIEICRQMLNDSYDGCDPGYPYADSDDARAWDYLDALATAEFALLDRVETWDNFYKENV